MMTVKACQSRAEIRVFEDVAEILHGQNKAFVPPYPGSVAKFFSPKSAFLKRHGELFPFLALRDGKPVGRIAAIVNHSHNKLYGDKTGFFGFWECEDNAETAQALFEAAERVLRERGFDVMRGPYNPSINDECGLLVEGHERAPFIGLTWNPPYYEALMEKQGFRPVWKAYGFGLPLETLEPPARLMRIMERMVQRSRLKLRPINMACLKEELQIVQEVYNATLERNWGFVPITMEDLLGAADDLRAIADPRMIMIAEMGGERAGVALSLPNINELLIRLKRTPRWLRPLHLLWLMKTRRIKTGRQIMYGIAPRFRDRGLHGWLMCEQFVKAKMWYAYAELAWIEDTNHEIINNAHMTGAVKCREWRIYERPVKPPGEG